MTDAALARLITSYAAAPNHSARKARLGELLCAKRHELLAKDVRARKARARVAARAETDVAASRVESIAAELAQPSAQIQALRDRVALECKTVRETLAFGAVLS